MEIEQILEKVLKATGFNDTDMASDKRTKITIAEVFKALILNKTRESAAKNLNITKSKLEYIINTRISIKLIKTKQENWHVFLLGLASLRRCAKCNYIKEIEKFTKDSSQINGRNGTCKDCSCLLKKEFTLSNPDYASTYRKSNPEQHREYTRTYQASKVNAVPKWADLVKIKEFYLNCPNGYQVDHWAPLNGKLVCGLHVIENLQYLTTEENLTKSNKFEV